MAWNAAALVMLYIRLAKLLLRLYHCSHTCMHSHRLRHAIDVLMRWSCANTNALFVFALLFGHFLCSSFLQLILLCIFFGQLYFDDETDRNYSILKCTWAPTARFMTIFQSYAFTSTTVIKRLIKNPVKILHQRRISLCLSLLLSSSISLSLAVPLTAFEMRQIPKCAPSKLCNFHLSC